MITVDGEPVADGPADGEDRDEELRRTRVELRLLKALAALDPPHGLPAIVHGRIAGHLRTLRRWGTADQATRQATDLSDGELREAAGIVRALLALPWWPTASTQPPHGLRAALSGYALDLAHEIDTRAAPTMATRDDKPAPKGVRQPCL